MAKKRKRFTLPKSITKLIFAFCITLLASFYFVVANTSTTAHLPDVTQPAQLYCTETQDDLCVTFTSAINKAKSSITLIIYSLTDPKIIKALKQKSEENVKVKVICDAKTSPNVERRLGKKVETLKRFGRGLMHQKILIIDESQTWIGSANMTPESLRHHGNLVTAIESKQIAEIAKNKADSYTPTHRNYLVPHKEIALGPQKIELWFLPDDPTAIDRLKKLIRSAQKTLRIAMFTWTRADLANAVIDAKKRGVDVQVVIDNNAGNGAGAKVVEILKKGSIPVKLSQGSALLHHKFMYIDEKILVNGSANWTKAAFTKNDDCFIVLYELTDQQKNFLNRAWKIIDSDSRLVN